MKMKHLIIVSLILAILTIGAVSASEDITSDGNLTVSDDVDVVAEDTAQDVELGDGDDGENEDSEYGIFVNEEKITTQNDVVATFVLPNTTKGSVAIFSSSGNNFFLVDLFHDDIPEDVAGSEYWSLVDGDLECEVWLSDLKFIDSVHDGDKVWFVVLDEDGNDTGEYTLESLIEIDDSYIQFHLKERGPVEFSANPDYVSVNNLTEQFLAVILRESITGNITVTRNWNDLIYSKNLTDFTAENIIDVNAYLLTVGENGAFVFENVDNDTLITVAFVDDDGNEIASQNYVYDRAGDSFRLLEGINEDDVELDVGDIDPEESDEPFAEISVPQKEGTFQIINSTGGILYQEDLTGNDAVYKKGGVFHLEISLDDWNDYIAQNIDGANNLTDLISAGIIDNKEVLVFRFIYRGNNLTSDKYEITTDTHDGVILFDEVKPADVEYGNLDIIMKDDYKNDVIATIIIKEEFDPTIVIKLNGTIYYDENLTFADGFINGNGYREFSITLNNLTGDLGAGDYELYIEISDNGESKWDNGDGPQWLRLFEPQIEGDENTTIEIIPVDTLLSKNDTLIVIKAKNTTGDVIVYFDDFDIPIIVHLADCRHDEIKDCYILGSKELGITTTGNYKLNVTYANVNLIGNVSLISNLEIEFRDPNDIVYTGQYADDSELIAFRLSDREIGPENVNGTLKVLIYLDGETPTLCFEGDIKNLRFNENMRAMYIGVSDLTTDSPLNGTYKVAVIYEGGSDSPTHAESDVAFKILGADDFGAEIGETSIKFAEYPDIDGGIYIVSDGLFYFNPIRMLKQFNMTELPLNYYIPDTDPHNVTIYYLSNPSSPLLLLATKIVQPADPALTISVANIEEGSAANVVITTSSAFSGNVTVQIGNVNYTVEVKDGKGSKLITGLTANTYTAKAIFEASGLFAASEKTTTFTVTKKASGTSASAPAKQTIKLTLKKVKVKRSAKKLVLKATLKINGKAVKGKIIKFKFNKKTYKAKTNKKGVAKVTIKKKVLRKLKVGKKVKIQATYGKVTKKLTVKVKK